KRAPEQAALEHLPQLGRRDRPRQAGDEDRQAPSRRHADLEALEVALPAPEADQVVQGGQPGRGGEELPAEAPQLAPQPPEVRIEPEADGDGNRQRDDEEKRAFQVSARITAAVATQPPTATMIGMSVSSTCSGSSPRSSRWTSSR